MSATTVASGILPDVKGGILPPEPAPRKLSQPHIYPSPVELRTLGSAGAGCPGPTAAGNPLAASPSRLFICESGKKEYNPNNEIRGTNHLRS